MRRALLGLVSLFAAAAALGCSGERMPRSTYQVALGNPQEGRRIIRETRCGSCHTIPGVKGAYGDVGPPLADFAYRSYIAGAEPNTPENLAHWIERPDEIDPDTAMPVLGLSDGEADAVAAYLYTLR
jgi:cytochrome c